MALCAISLGGNVGDVPATFAVALQELAAKVGAAELRSSRVYRTAAMGADAGEAFLNAAWVFETRSSANDVLTALQQIETDCGRVRTVRWGPRTLDLDLIFHGEDVIDSPPRLMVPHPGCWYRRFVLDPLAELIPNFVHPVLKQSIRELREQLLIRPLPVSVWGGLPELHPALMEAATAQFAEVEWIEASAALGETASIRFAFPEAAPGNVPRTVMLPGNLPAAISLVRDVLTAALDEPIAVNEE